MMKAYSFFIFMFAMNMLLIPYGVASVEQASPSRVEAFRGDTLILRVSGSALAESSWWVGLEKICDGPTCEIKTGQWPRGLQRLQLHSPIGAKWEIVDFTIDIKEPAPLYQPRRLESPLEPVKNRLRIMATPSFNIVARRGHLLAVQGVKQSEIPSPGPLPAETMISVPAGSAGIVLTPHPYEEILTGESTLFAAHGGALDVMRGDFLWRRLEGPSEDEAAPIAKPYIQVSILNYSGTLTATSAGDVLIRVKDKNSDHTTESVDVAVLSGDLSVACVGIVERTLHAGEWLRLRLRADNGGCEVKGPMNILRWHDLHDALTPFETWWIDKGAPMQSERWRREFSLISAHHDDDECATAMGFVETKLWGSALDAFLQCSDNVGEDPDLLLSRGEARLRVGLAKESEQDLQRSLLLRPNNGRAAALLGELFSGLENYENALTWNLLAVDWDRVNRAEYYSRASDAALRLKRVRDAARYAEWAYVYEQDDTAAAKDLDHATKVLATRSYQVDIETFFDVKSHVLPLNPAVMDKLPNGAKTNRGFAFGGNIDWHRDAVRQPSFDLEFHGHHDLLVPVNSAHIPAMVSRHELGPEFSLGLDSRYYVTPTLGTLITGAGRQTDAFKFAAGMRLPTKYPVDVSLYSLRAFDPAPGKSDSLDVGLDRYVVGSSDHSHFDLGLNFAVDSSTLASSWRFQTNVAQVDFRTGALDAYDFTQISADFSYQNRFARRWAAIGRCDVVDRIFKEGGSDQSMRVGGSMAFLLAPLYWLNLDLSVGKRSAADSVLSYSFHTYGLSLLAKI